MKAARFHGQRDLRVEDVNVPQIQDGQVLVEIEWCGICGSDLHEYIVGPRVIPVKERPHPLTGAILPITMGHEFCGRISKVNGASKLKVGQPVMVDPRLFCSKCHACDTGDSNICDGWGFLGLSSDSGGGFSEFVAVDEQLCHILPDSVPLSEAALIEPLTVARHALRKSGFDDYRDKNVLILGGGPVGLAVIFVLKASGVGKIIVSEPTAKRQQQTGRLVDVVLDPTKVKVGNECRDLTNGIGVDIMFDCAGIMPGLRDGMDALRKGGTYVNVAGWEQECIVPMQHFMLKELLFRSSMSYTSEDFKQTVDEYVQGKFKGFQDLITARIGLDDIVARGFEQLIDHKDDHVKIMVTPKKELLAR